MQKYKAVIFDLDGTLLDTLDDLYECTNYALRYVDCPLRSKADIRNFVGNGIRELICRALPNGENDEHFNKCYGQFKMYYKQHCIDKTKPYDGVKTLLQSLKNNGVATAIVSNKADFAVKILKDKFFDGVVDVAIGQNDNIAPKPSPDALLLSMQKLGVNKCDTVYIGDSDVDIYTAKNAGVDCISVDWGFRDEDFLRANGANIIVKSAKELQKLLIR